MLYGAKVNVCSDIYTKHINTLCEHNIGFVDVKHSGIQTNSGQYGTNKIEEKALFTAHSLLPPPSLLLVHLLSNPTIHSPTIMVYCHITVSLKTPTVFKLSQSSLAMKMMDWVENSDNQRD
jgi:hypothetical protein